jgi:hypothetical protein
MGSRDGENRGVCGFKAVGVPSCLALGFVARVAVAEEVVTLRVIRGISGDVGTPRSRYHTFVV